MRKLEICLYLCISWLCGIHASVTNSNKITDDDKWPIVVVAIIVRDQAFALPLFLAYFERLNYPKKRMVLWIRSNQNSDNSGLLLELWLNHTSSLYRSVDCLLDCNTQLYPNETNKLQLMKEMNMYYMFNKDAALKYAHQIKADYIFFLDGNEFFTYSDTLKHLINLDLPVVAPMLRVESFPEFLATQNAQTNLPAYIRQVSVITHAMLINMNHEEAPYLTFHRERFRTLQQQRRGEQCFDYGQPIMDFAIFGAAAACLKIPLFVFSKFYYGYKISSSIYARTLEENLMELQNIRSQLYYHDDGMAPISDYFQKFIVFPEKTKLTLDHIYMINLKRRPDRRAKMVKVFNELGLDVEHFLAVDGRNFKENLMKWNITLMRGYLDPTTGYPMHSGEIACFLSHYNIWQKIVALQQKRVLIFEDDLYFYKDFNQRALEVLQKAESLADYDMIYFGRLAVTKEHEPWLKGNDDVQYAGYSLWAIGYVITLRGAEKLLAAKPLEKLLPVDEFLPIMSKCHPNKAMRDAFPVRNLITLSSKRDLISQEGCDSDTYNFDLHKRRFTAFN